MVSIIVPTYNREKLLPRAVESVLRQTYQDWELLVVDDGSTDNTKEIIKKYCDKDCRIHYFHKENGGQGSARNLGIRNAQGTYVAFLDSDDEWLPEKLQEQVSVLEQHGEYDFCYTADIVRDEKTGATEIKRWKHADDLPFMKLAGIAVSVPSSHCYRKSAFEKIGLFDEDKRLIGLEDNDWSVRGYSLKGYYLDDALTLYHVHEGQITKENMSGRLERSISGLTYILEKNLSIIARNKKAFVFRQQQIGHLHMLAGQQRFARKYFMESWRLDGSVKSMVLITLTCFPASFYRFLNKRRIS